MSEVDLPQATDADARALSSPLRMRILRMCLDDALTNKQIATKLGLPPASVYHHVRTLAKRGFLAAQTERTGNRGAREVPYLATRKSWSTPMLPGSSRILIDTFLAEVAQAEPESVNVVRLGVRLTPEREADFFGRIVAVLEEYATTPADPDGRPISVFFASHTDAART